MFASRQEHVVPRHARNAHLRFIGLVRAGELRPNILQRMFVEYFHCRGYDSLPSNSCTWNLSNKTLTQLLRRLHELLEDVFYPSAWRERSPRPGRSTLQSVHSKPAPPLTQRTAKRMLPLFTWIVCFELFGGNVVQATQHRYPPRASGYWVSNQHNSLKGGTRTALLKDDWCSHHR